MVNVKESLGTEEYKSADRPNTLFDNTQSPQKISLSVCIQRHMQTHLRRRDRFLIFFPGSFSKLDLG